MKKKLFGQIDGKNIYVYTLENDKIAVDVINYGATVKSVRIKHDNTETDVVLGYNTLAEYQNGKHYFGATVGRCANRIDGAEFYIGKRKYTLDKNDGQNSHHGGSQGFFSKVWTAKSDGNSLVMSYVSPDGEMGYPGKMKVSVKFTIDGGALSIEYFAVSNKDTIVNLTNHSYFNLDGEDSGDILDTKLFINANCVTPVGKTLVPHGDFIKIVGTPVRFFGI